MIDGLNTAISTSIASSTDGVTQVLTNNLPTIMLFFGAMVGLGILIRLFKKFVGRKA